MSTLRLGKGYIALRLDQDTREKLDVLANATGWRRADIVSEAVRRFVNQGLAELMELQERGELPGMRTGGSDGDDEPPLTGGRKIIV